MVECKICNKSFDFVGGLLKHLEKSNCCGTKEYINSFLKPLFECYICNKRFKSVHSLSIHLSNSHTDWDKEEYYNIFIEKVSSCPVCGKDKRFLDLSQGFSKTCSMKCKDKHPDRIKRISNSKKKEWSNENSKINKASSSNEKKNKLKDENDPYSIHMKKMSKNYWTEEGKEISKEKAKTYLKSVNLNLLSSYRDATSIVTVECIKCGEIFHENYLKIYQRINGCILCVEQHTRSSWEDIVIDIIQENYPEVLILKNDRIVLEGKEIDVLLPNIKTSIEVNGLYWHQDIERDKFKARTMVKKGFKHLILTDNDFKPNFDLKYKICGFMKLDFKEYKENLDNYLIFKL